MRRGHKVIPLLAISYAIPRMPGFKNILSVFSPMPAIKLGKEGLTLILKGFFKLKVFILDLLIQSSFLFFPFYFYPLFSQNVLGDRRVRGR